MYKYRNHYIIQIYQKVFFIIRIQQILEKKKLQVFFLNMHMQIQMQMEQEVEEEGNQIDHPFLTLIKKYSRNQINSPIGKIQIGNSESKIISGTCVLISPCYVITVRHTLHASNQSKYTNPKGSKQQIVQKKNYEKVTIKFYINQKIMNFYLQEVIELFNNQQSQIFENQLFKYADQDIILLKLKKSIVEITPIKVHQLITDEKQTNFVNFIKCEYEYEYMQIQGKPSRKIQKQLKEQETNCTFNSFQKNQISLIGDNQKLQTKKGDSGSPIFQLIKNQWKCVGMLLLNYDKGNLGQQKICLSFTQQIKQKIQNYTKPSQQIHYQKLYENLLKMLKFSKDDTKDGLKYNSLSFQGDGISCCQFLVHFQVFKQAQFFKKHQIKQMKQTFYLSQLRSLNLNKNKIKYLPNLNQKLYHLEKLELRQNQIQFYGSQDNENNLKNVVSIKQVDISQNQQKQQLNENSFPQYDQNANPFLIGKFILQGYSFMKFLFNLQFLKIVTQKHIQIKSQKQNFKYNKNDKTTISQQFNSFYDSSSQFGEQPQNKIFFSVRLKNQKSFKQMFQTPLKELQKLLEQNTQIWQNLHYWNIQIQFQDICSLCIDFDQINEKSQLFQVQNLYKEKYCLKCKKRQFMIKQ